MQIFAKETLIFAFWPFAKDFRCECIITSVNVGWACTFGVAFKVFCAKFAHAEIVLERKVLLAIYDSSALWTLIYIS